MRKDIATADRWQQLSQIYLAALERDTADRDAFLRETCAGDEGLRREIESLFGYEGAADPWIERPAAALAAPMLENSASSSGLTGRQIGPYQIGALLGAGGMGEVYRARDVKLGRDVAIKVLPAQFIAEQERSARFTREARILATLSHPHIGAIYGLEESDGLTALVLELVEGPTLAECLAHGPLPISEALTIARQVADALDAAHAKGIVHRDLKPSNVVIQRTTRAAADAVRVRVLDFGLGKLTSMLPQAEADHTSVSLATADGRLLGTPAYMSPEQTRGHAVDKRADIWAFGAMLFEMLAGRRAFEGDTVADTFARILEYEPDWAALPSDTPAPIRRLLERCLQKDLRQRMHDISDAVLEIDDAMYGRAGAPPPMTVPARVVRRERRRKVKWVLAGTLTVAVVAAATFLWTTRNDGTTVKPALIRLTSNPSDMFVTSAHIAPDGRNLAFADRTGLKVRSIDSGRVHRFGDTEGMNVYGWTPDSASVLASQCDDVSCVGWAISLVGQDRHRLSTTWSYSEQLRVSPDGQRLLRLGIGIRQRTLTMDPMNGLPAIKLASGDLGGRPTWSADGKRVFVIRFTANTIESLPAEGGTPLEVFRGPKDQPIVDAIELPDRTILFSMYPPRSIPLIAGQSELWRAYPDRTGVVREAPRRLEVGVANATYLTASSAGRVAFLNTRFQSDVYVANGDLRSGSLDVPRRFTLTESDNFAYAWTPDSSAVLLSSTRDGTWDIFKQRLDSDIAEPFRSGPGHQGVPGLTSDGRWVLYADGTGTDDSIMRVSVSGGAPAEVVPHVGSGHLQCAERGRCVLIGYESKDRSRVISSLDPFQGKGDELLRIPLATGFRLLPDGNAFAYIVPSENNRIWNRVRVVSFTGKPDTEIVVKGAAVLSGLGWLPSNAGFVSTDRGTSTDPGKLLLISLDGTSKVLWAPTGVASIGWAVPSPDERHLVINVYTRHSNVWMVSGL